MLHTPRARIFRTVLAVMVLLTICLETLCDVKKERLMAFNSSRTNDNISVADALAKEVRVLCCVMTHPKNHMTKAIHVKATWGKRCNKLLFMSTEEEALLPTIKLPVEDGYDFLWGKTKAAFKYIYDHHRDDADWFLKADDDTYVVVENLRFMLSEHNSSDPLYFGYRLHEYHKSYISEGYMSGGAGYVLSKEALDRFVNKALPSPQLCNADNTGAEDFQIGFCLNRIGVKGMDAEDDFGYVRFMPLSLQKHLNHSRNNLFVSRREPRRIVNVPFLSDLMLGIHGRSVCLCDRRSNSKVCCSDHAISFHRVDPTFMYFYDFLVYRFRIYGMNYSET